MFENDQKRDTCPVFFVEMEKKIEKEIPVWFFAPHIKFSNQEKNIILDFCKIMKLKCECETKPMRNSKYCILCFNIVKNENQSEIQIDKEQWINVKTIIKYHNFIAYQVGQVV